jgi:hypothetical protein
MNYLEDTGLACIEFGTYCQEPTSTTESGLVEEAGGDHFLWPLIDFDSTHD